MSNIDQTKLDIFRAKVEQRKACEKKAFETSMELIDQDKVNDETLINTAIFIDQERYRGVNEDRALKQICGYPICSNPLPTDIPKHQYFINVKVNKVIDTTERRLFCSTFCYKASKYFERQIPTSPVWAREEHVDHSLKIELLNQETVNQISQDTSTIISHSNYIRSIPQISHRRDSSSSSSSDDDDDFEQLQLARDQYYKSRLSQQPKLNFVEKKLQQISLPDHIRTDNITIDFVISCLYEWITEKTKIFLQNSTIISTTSIDSQRYQQFVNRLDIEDMMSGEISRGEKNLPTMEQLRQTTTEKSYELKVKEFFVGKEEQPTTTSAIILPPIDAYSQQTIRLSIVSEKIMTCFKQIFTNNFEDIKLGDLRSILSELLLTFNFTSENITFKSNEWTIMTLFLLHLLTIKLSILLNHLTSSRIIHSLFENLNLSSDHILHIVKYLLEQSSSSSSKSTINFEEID